MSEKARNILFFLVIENASQLFAIRFETADQGGYPWQRSNGVFIIDGDDMTNRHQDRTY